MTSTRPSTTHRPLGVLVAALAAVLLVVLLAPSGRTEAAWSDAVAVDVPATTTGGLSLTTSGAVSGSTTVTPGGTVTGTWAPSTVSVTAGGVALTGAQLAGSRLEYRVSTGGSCTAGAATFTANPSGAGTSFAVTGGAALSGTRTLCVTLVPSEALRASHPGVALNVTTTLAATQAGAGTWTAGSTWTTTQQLPALPAITSVQCRDITQNREIEISWNWVDGATGRPSPVDPQSFRLERRSDSGQWQPLTTVSSADARSVRLTRDSIRTNIWDRQYHDVRVVATLPGNRNVTSTAHAAITTLEFIILPDQIACA